MTEAQTQRLFFALWPEEGLRKRLAGLAQTACPEGMGRRVLPENLHVTLAFLGNVTAEVKRCMVEVASGLTGQAFTLILDRLGYFRRSRVLWVGPAKIPDPLHRLARELHGGLNKCGIPPGHRPYQGHLTLARKVNRVPSERLIEPFEWEVHGFVLVESLTLPGGVQYQVIRSWPLHAQ
jgi:2'-5' RNA ligase